MIGRPAGFPLRWRPRTAGLSLLSALLLAACAVPPGYRPAGAPARPAAGASALPSAPPDVALIPDAVPRNEPRSPLGNPPFYEVDGRRYVVLSTAAGYDERGVASWYGPGFHGLRTATGEPYDMFAMTAAHKTLPLPCYARVTNLSNGRSVVVRINDRGPFVANRIIDLSYTAAAKLGMLRTGTAFVEVQTLTPSGPPTQTVSLPASSAVAAAASLGPSSVPPLSQTARAALPLAQAPSDRAPATATARQFFIQVGAFAQLQNAQRAESRLRTAGLPAFMLAPDAHEALLRVRVGPLASVQQFDAVIMRLRTLGYPSARLAQD
jgi:peptidoglycan lytic transglycosylase